MLTTSLLLLALAAPVQGPADPAGDPPPALAPGSSPTSPTSPAAAGTPGITIVVMPTVGLGVDAALVTRASAALGSGVATRAIVVDGVSLPEATQDALAGCESFRCAEHLEPLNADFVVTSSLGLLGSDVVLTVRLRATHAVKRLQVQGSAQDVEALAMRAVAALPLEPPTARPATPALSEPPEAPSPPAVSSSPTTTAAYPPEVMILVYFGLGLVPVAGSPLILPLVQGFVAQQVGPELVGLKYKDWGVAVVAGYATYVIGGTIGIGSYVTGVVVASTGNATAGVALVAVGGLTLLATVVAEPVVFHLVSSMNTEPAGADDR